MSAQSEHTRAAADVAIVREAHAKAMEALGADVHPYSAIAIRDHEAAMDAALVRLAASVENLDDNLSRVQQHLKYEVRKHRDTQEALAELVALKDGPRDADYERRKPLARDGAAT